MLLVDDILLAPARGLFWILREIRSASEEEATHEADAITAQLSQLYMMLETGQISEAEFDRDERKLLDRLEAIQEWTVDSEGEGGETEADTVEETPAAASKGR